MKEDPKVGDMVRIKQTNIDEILKENNPYLNQIGEVLRIFEETPYRFCVATEYNPIGIWCDVWEEEEVKEKKIVKKKEVFEGVEWRMNGNYLVPFMRASNTCRLNHVKNKYTTMTLEWEEEEEE